MIRLACLFLTGFIYLALAQNSSPFKFTKSTSGVSGQIKGPEFVLDEPRSQFKVPADKQLIVSFNWVGPTGKLSIQGLWKQPDGKIASISELNLDTKTPFINAYFQLNLAESMPSGVWELETRINGLPSGSHIFQIEAGAPAAKVVATGEMEKSYPSMDELYQLGEQSIVTIHKLDERGRDFDVSQGFVIGKDAVLATYQGLEGATKLRLIFADLTKVETATIRVFSSAADWAILEAPTKDVPSVKMERDFTPKIGDSMITFTSRQVANDGRIPTQLSGYKIAGREPIAGFTDRIRFSLGTQFVPSEAGSPVLNLEGKVVGMIAGYGILGSRPGYRAKTASAINASGSTMPELLGLHPIKYVPASFEGAQSKTLSELAQAGQMVMPIEPSPNLSTVYLAEDSRTLRPGDLDPVSRVSKSLGRLVVSSQWQLFERFNGKPLFSCVVFDQLNRVVAKSAPKPLTLQADNPSTVRVTVETANLTPARYRVDLLLDQVAIYRLFFTLTE
jgi:hypothetical protein